MVQGRSIEAVASSACLTLPHRLQCRAASLAVATAAAFAAYVAAAAAVAASVASAAVVVATTFRSWKHRLGIDELSMAAAPAAVAVVMAAAVALAQLALAGGRCCTSWRGPPSTPTSGMGSAG